MIENIKVKSLYPHPDNPRKDVGDVSELAESLKASGVFQNLTVVKGGKGVPKGKDGYTVIIGHRRLAAAKLAKIDELPCSVVEMDEKTQVSTMLLENMQRVDLTFVEQAQGFQMMLDLGETADSISEKTGFSKNTVKNRIKLLKLDSEKMKEAQTRGGTLEQYITASGFVGEAQKAVMDAIGTNNFDYVVQQKKREIEQVKWQQKVLSMIPDSAVKIKDDWKSTSEYTYCYGLNVGNSIDGEKLNEVFQNEPLYYTVSNYSICFYKEKEKFEPKVDEKAEKQRAERERCRAAISEIAKNSYELRRDFLKKFKVIKENEPEALEFAAKLLSVSCYGDVEASDLCELMGVDFDNDNEDDGYFEQKIEECIEKSAVKTIMCEAYLIFEDAAQDTMYYNGEYQKNEGLIIVLNAFETIGYCPSDDEKSYADGSNENYVRRNENDR